MRVLIDYRAALRQRSGVGEYAHQLSRALLRAEANSTAAGRLDLTLFTSSWKDRPVATPDVACATTIDRRVPVSVLNFAWHRFGWPPIEWLTGRTFDVVHSMHPLHVPSRSAAQVITIHDLNFLAHPERTRAEIKRDYVPLARAHALRADAVIVVSQFTAREVERQFGVPADAITVCSPGAPEWTPRKATPPDGYVLFFGTLEPRKNVGGLLDAYEQLVMRNGAAAKVPDLVLAGQATEEARPWIERVSRPPLAGHVRHIGYVDPSRRRELYEGARLLVQPSFEEGFGIPVLEAMSLGVPVVAANRGALPEVLGDAGPLVDPTNPTDIAEALRRLTSDPSAAAEASARGLKRAQEFNWDRTAARVLEAYRRAVERKRRRMEHA